MSDVRASTALGRLFRDCRSAGTKLRQFVLQNPFDKRAPYAQQRVASCFEEEKNWEEAENAWRAFLILYPGHQEVPRALFGQANASFEQRESLDRDPSKLRNSLALYAQLVRDYPEDEWARKAVSHYNEIRNMLAEHSYKIGRWYEHARRPLAALTRYTATAQRYAGTEFGRMARDAAQRLDPRLDRNAARPTLLRD